MRLRLSPHSLLLCLFLLCLALPSCAQQKLSLVRDGKSDYSILLSPTAPRSVKVAATDLQSYIEKSTGAKLPLLTQDTAPATPLISVGETAASRAAGITTQGVAHEGFRLVTRNNNIFILGPDTANDAKTPQGGTSNGTSNGVYTFLEDYLNIRWLLPGEMGEDVPKMPTVEIPTLDRNEAPGFLNRRLPYAQNNKASVGAWELHQKLGFSVKLEHYHNWQTVFPPELYAQHPEWFAEIGGQRVQPVGDRYKVETTNPAVVQHYAEAAIAAFRADPTLYTFSLSPTDSRNWSQSKESQAYYEKDPHGNFSNTPLILKFYNDVAKIVGKEFPDRKLAGYIYADYLYPPAAGVPPLEPNLFLVIAPSISYGYTLYRPDVQQDWDNIFKAWSSQTSNISYYDLPNTLTGSAGNLTPPAPEILNFIFSRLVKYKIKGTYIYGTEAWSQAGVSNYVLARLMWNPNQDANAIAHEFYQRAYGEAAGAPMEQLYKMVDAAVKDYYNKNPDASYTTTPGYMKDVLAANYPRVVELYNQATAAAANATPQQQARLRLFGDNLALMQWQLRAHGLLPEDKNAPLYRTDAQIEDLISTDVAGFGIALAPGLAKTNVSFAPVKAERQPALTAKQPATPYNLRGKTRILFFPSSDQEIQITPAIQSARTELIRYEVHDALGKKVTGGVLRTNETIRFASNQNQVYYLDIGAGSAIYSLKISGAPYAFAANPTSRGFWLQSHATPLYFYVPADVEKFSIVLNTDAPGETSLEELYSPSGKLLQTLKTETTPVARFDLKKAGMPTDWEGFWCLSVKPAPTGVLDDVMIQLDKALPQWFSTEAGEPMKITPLTKAEE